MRQKIIRGILFLAVLLLLIWLVKFTDPREILRRALLRIQELGPWGPFWFVIAYIVACLTFFPGIILTLGGGILFGVWWGSFYVCLGATIGACLAFSASRYFARGWVLRKFGQNARFQVIDEAVAKHGWKVAALIRLSPAFPFIPMNFVFGLTRIPLWQFAIVTYFAIWPLTALFAYVGELAGDLASIGAKPVASGPMKWVITGIGITSTLVVTAIVTRLARRHLRELPPKAENSVAK